MQVSFTRFDDALIEYAFQPIADLINDRIGLDRLRVVGVCLNAASVAWILSQAGALTNAVVHWDAAASFLRIVLLLLGLVALTSLGVVFRRARIRNGANPLRVAMLPHRGIVVALLAARLVAFAGFAGAADLAMLGFAGCALYLGACAARPPAHRRNRWLAISGAR